MTQCQLSPAIAARRLPIHIQIDIEEPEQKMSDPSFADILAELVPEQGGLTVPVPESWMQGRTAFGGLTGGLLLAAARRLVPDLPPLRSALVNFTAPLGERPLLKADLMRRGRNVTTVRAEAEADGQTTALATFTFGAARDSHVRMDRPAPEAVPPEEAEPMIPPQALDFAPRFFRNFDVQLIAGSRPVTAADRGYIRAWARHKASASWTAPEALLCIGDILPPAVYPMLKKPGPNSSMTWICNVLDDDLSTEDGWWQVETDLSAARDGYSSQVMRAWNSRGDLVLDGMQAVAVFV